MNSQLPSEKRGDRFDFRHFSIQQDRCAMKVGIDAVLLGAWAMIPPASSSRMLDIGAGTGILSLLLAQRAPEAQVFAIEIDEAAAEQAQENFTASPFGPRIIMDCLSIQEFSDRNQPAFDLIICNPPFFSGGVLSEQLGRNVARHTVKLSHGDLLAAVRKLLTEEGEFSLILPKIEALRFRELAAGIGLFLHRSLTVRPRTGKSVNRILQTFGKIKSAKIEESEVVQYAEGQEWSAEFKRLVAPYYPEK